MYDFLIVGAGLTGATLARRLTDAGRSCLVVDKRSHVAGNCHTEVRDGIVVHRYGPHCFHTNSLKIWNWITQFGDWKTYVLRAKAYVGGELFSFPINLFTLHQMWGVHTPAEAQEVLDRECERTEGDDAESYLLRTVGRELYETFYRGYTVKQWRKEPRDLPASVVSRIPVRLTFDDSYHVAKYSGIPLQGYTAVVEEILDGIHVELGTAFSEASRGLARQTIYTGPIDALYDYKWGPLEYRSLRFEHERIDSDFYQGGFQVNYPSADVPYTRILEYKHLDGGPKGVTWICREYPETEGDPYYPVRTPENVALSDRYRAQAEADGVIVAGRLGRYKYLDMDQAIGAALLLADRILVGKLQEPLGTDLYRS